MSENSNIEWTDHTFNGWMGCTKVGPGCDHCYAEELMDKRYGKVHWGVGQPRVRTSASNWKQPLRWERQAAAFLAEHGRRQRVFCSSLADVFDNAVDPQWRADLFALIRATPSLDWLLLTKRIGNVPAMVAIIPGWLPENVWLGITIVNQAEADRDIPKLLAVPARVRFLSMEPLLGPVDLRLRRPVREDDRQDMDGWCSHITTAAGAGIHWVIVGGESGSKARPMHPQWARHIRDQCAAASVPMLFKQHGEWSPGSGDFGRGSFQTAAVALDGRVAPGGFDVSSYPRGSTSADGWSMVHRAGKKAAGRLLDGVQHDGFPKVR